MSEIIGKLNSFLTDAVILRLDYSIHALGSDIELLTLFSSSELSGQAFTKICLDLELQAQLESELSKGYFSDINAIFLNKRGEKVEVNISGFYLGLISDINGYIVLKIKLRENNSTLKKELVTKKREIDSFIYRAAHDLRGPLATIKGLVNLMKLRQNDLEVDELTTLIEIHANKLDDRLFKLLYLSHDNSISETCKGFVDFPVLRGALEKTLRDNFQLESSVLEFIPMDQNLYGVNEIRLSHLLSTILLYIVGLPLASIRNRNEIVIRIDFTSVGNKLDIMIKAYGFLTSDKIKDAVQQPTSLYNDILNYPFLFNYYIAQKEAMQLNAFLRIDFITEREQSLHLSIPLAPSMFVTRALEILKDEGIPE